MDCGRDEGGSCLEALAVYDGRAALVVLLLRDPHLLEGGEGGEDGAADPDGVLALGRSDDLDLHRGWGEGGDFLLHAVGDAGEHGGAARLENVSLLGRDTKGFGCTCHDNVAVEILTDVDVALHDGVEGGDVDATAFKTKHRGLEEGLRSTETLVANGDDLAVRKFVGLLQAGGLAGSLDLLLEVEGNVAELLLDVTDNFTLGSRGESVAALGKNLHEVVGQVTASHVDTRDGVGKRETFVDGHNVGDTVAGVKHDTRGTTGGVQRKHGLDGDVEGRRIEGLEDDLGHLLSVRLGVDRGFGEKNRVLLRGNTQFVVEGVVPNLLHVVPIRDDAVLNGISQREDTTLRLCLITDVGIFLAHADHDAAIHQQLFE